MSQTKLTILILGLLIIVGCSSSEDEEFAKNFDETKNSKLHEIKELCLKATDNRIGFSMFNASDAWHITIRKRDSINNISYHLFELKESNKEQVDLHNIKYKHLVDIKNLLSDIGSTGVLKSSFNNKPVQVSFEAGYLDIGELEYLLYDTIFLRDDAKKINDSTYFMVNYPL